MTLYFLKLLKSDGKAQGQGIRQDGASVAVDTVVHHGDMLPCQSGGKDKGGHRQLGFAY